MIVFQFRLPRGYVAADGKVHVDGVMRLATVADELSAASDRRVLKHAPWLPVALLSRVVTSLGTVDRVTPEVIEGLFASDFAYLRRLYDQLNHQEAAAPVYRSVKVVLVNTTDEHLVVQGFAAVTGSWRDALKPTQDMLIPPQSAAEWASVSTEAGCGISAFVRFASSRGHAQVHWELPWTGEFSVAVDEPPGMICTTTVDSSRRDAVAVVVAVKAGHSADR